MKGIKTTKEDIYDILKMREKGLSLRSIAKNTGISPATIYRIVKENKFYDGPMPQKVEKRPVVNIESDNTLSQKVSQTNIKESAQNSCANNAQAQPLRSFSSRQLIKELYDRGYRIEKEGLFVIEKKKVLLNDILNEA